MKKIVINRCYGAFELSEEAEKLLGADKFHFLNKRDDPLLIQIVESMGERANGEYGYLKIVEIPDDVGWIICSYDGMEWVAEKHRTWTAPDIEGSMQIFW